MSKLAPWLIGDSKLNALPGGIVFPDWNSADEEVERDGALDASAIRSLDCVELDRVQ